VALVAVPAFFYEKNPGDTVTSPEVPLLSLTVSRGGSRNPQLKGFMFVRGMGLYAL